MRLSRPAEAQIIRKQLSIAAAGADISVEFSCFCRLGTMDKNKTTDDGFNGEIDKNTGDCCK